jgi:hypothetical protein
MTSSFQVQFIHEPAACLLEVRVWQLRVRGIDSMIKTVGSRLWNLVGAYEPLSTVVWYLRSCNLESWDLIDCVNECSCINCPLVLPPS